MPFTPDPYENAPDAGHGIEGNEPSNQAGADSMNSLDLTSTEPEWITYEDVEESNLGYTVEHRQVDGLFGCGNVAITVEARRDNEGTIPFVAVRTDLEAMLDVDGIDRLIAALAWARQDLARVAGDLR